MLTLVFRFGLVLLAAIDSNCDVVFGSPLNADNTVADILNVAFGRPPRIEIAPEL